jgi:hypothetical protein
VPGGWEGKEKLGDGGVQYSYEGRQGANHARTTGQAARWPTCSVAAWQKRQEVTASPMRRRVTSPLWMEDVAEVEVEVLGGEEGG